ncbi:MAG: type II toxin-antitoxin system RelE/ParE family toxin [Bacteroidales bacterium]|nr:type II toxin-antitoxin system RelE/ParE family toxin [Bacteroidales bacterium]
MTLKYCFYRRHTDSLTPLIKKTRDKIFYDIDKSRKGRDSRVFKKLENTDGIWEFRTDLKNIEYRLLAFWDKNKRAFVIATHGFVKKTQKTPSKEIKKSQQIRKQYYGQE